MDNRLRGERRRRRRRRSIRSGRAHFNWNSHDDRPSVPATDHKVLSTDWQSFVQLFSKSRWRTKVSAGLEIDIRPFLDRTESFLIYLISIQITLNLQINIDTSSQSRKVSGQRKKKKKKKNSVHWLIKGHFQKLCCQGSLLSSNRYCPRCGISPARMLSEKFSAVSWKTFRWNKVPLFPIEFSDFIPSLFFLGFIQRIRRRWPEQLPGTCLVNRRTCSINEQVNRRDIP